jgi:hypothetical protein
MSRSHDQRDGKDGIVKVIYFRPVFRQILAFTLVVIFTLEPPLQPPNSDIPGLDI